MRAAIILLIAIMASIMVGLAVSAANTPATVRPTPTITVRTVM